MPVFSFKPAKAKEIACYHCGRLQEVGQRAVTLTCQHCSKPLQVGDVQVKGYDARRKVQTVGSLVVEKKGQIVADSVECGDLVVRGQLKSKQHITALGKSLIGPKALVEGNLAAPLLTVAAGATLHGYYCIGRGDQAKVRAALLGLPVEQPPEGLAGEPESAAQEKPKKAGPVMQEPEPPPGR